jgi:endonuclease YncB( thermonuclease family)
MGGWAPFVVAGLLCGAVLEARAQDSPFHSSFHSSSRCTAEMSSAGRVERVIDGRSFALDDGREIRLASLEVPPAAGTSPAGQASRAALAAMVAGETVMLGGVLGRVAGAPDRYGRTVAHAFTPGAAQPRAVAQFHAVAHALLAAGHARVGAEIGDPACAAELYSHEREARIAKRGLWSQPQYGIVDAGDLTGLVAGRGRFSVVEGKVLSVRETGGTIYVNFGRRWSEALTVTISKRQERIFTGAGREPKALENRRLRVRGWIEVRNGPRIEASRPEQIELVAAN